MHGPPHPLLPPVGNLAQIVALVTMLDHLERPFLIEQNVNRKIHVGRAQARGVKCQDTPDTYYEAVDGRVPGHGEDLNRLRARRILIDGAPTQNQGLLLQIFTQNVVGPCFFEIIQRKGNEGFGEGNFKALFESLELDQIRRGVLSSQKDAKSAS